MKFLGARENCGIEAGAVDANSRAAEILATQRPKNTVISNLQQNVELFMAIPHEKRERTPRLLYRARDFSRKVNLLNRLVVRIEEKDALIAHNGQHRSFAVGWPTYEDSEMLPTSAPA